MLIGHKRYGNNVIQITERFEDTRGFGSASFSDKDHFLAALETDTPHSYISARASTGLHHNEPGIGYMNAVALHKLLIDPEYTAISIARDADVRGALLAYRVNVHDVQALIHTDASFNAAIKKIGYDRLPLAYRIALGEEECRQQHLMQIHDHAR